MHCIICNQCIDDFDHHCFWVNNCIGGNNLTIFLVFLVSVTINLGFNMLLCIYSKKNFLLRIGFIDTREIEIKIFPNVYYFVEALPVLLIMLLRLCVLCVASMFFIPVV